MAWVMLVLMKVDGGGVVVEEEENFRGANLDLCAPPLQHGPCCRVHVTVSLAASDEA